MGGNQQFKYVLASPYSDKELLYNLEISTNEVMSSSQRVCVCVNSVIPA